MKNNNSFTLIELLVVISILSLLILIVFSGMRGTTDRARIAKVLQYQASLHRSLGADIIGWWQFDEGAGTTVKDISGYENNGETHGSPQWVDGVPGTQGYALEFDGTDDYMEADDSYKNVEELTVSFWFWNSGEVSAYRNFVLGNADRHSVNNPGFRFIMGYNNPKRIQWRVEDNDGNLVIRTVDNLLVEQWSYVVGVLSISENRSEIWINGNIENSGTAGNAEFSGDGTQFRIGRNIYDETIPNNSIIDDVRIYSRALTAKEVQRIYAETKNKYLSEK